MTSDISGSLHCGCMYNILMNNTIYTLRMLYAYANMKW